MSRGWRVGLFLVGAVILTGPVQAQAGTRPFQEYAETHKDWKLYCQIWTANPRVECELASRNGSDKSSRVVWLRSSERWLDGLRFRLDEAGTDVSKPIRVWVDGALFRPEFPCKPFSFEPNTCAVSDPDTNRKLVEKMMGGKREVSAVGSSPTGAKSEVRFSLNGFKAALERMEQLRAEAGTPWM